MWGRPPQPDRSNWPRLVLPKGSRSHKRHQNIIGRTPKKSRTAQPVFPARPASKDGYTFIGHHGTSRKGATNLMTNGVMDNHSFSNSSFENLLNGEGFYVSDSLSGAQDYTGQHLMKDNGGIVLKVSVKNFHNKRIGVDYVRGTPTLPNSGVTTLYESTYRDIKLTRYGYYAPDRKFYLYP
ncbi:hypothetical protein IMF27_02915 [Pseudomonas sp. PCH199]|nr:hypothetical protein [Pseudomonas sp. PCH199]